MFKLKTNAGAFFSAALIVTFPMSAQAGNYVAEKAVKGAVVGAAVAKVSGGDVSQGAATGAAIGAVSGAIDKNDAEENIQDRANNNGGNKKRGQKD